jgi:hypothetical protein
MDFDWRMLAECGGGTFFYMMEQWQKHFFFVGRRPVSG